jgi:regulatory protein
VAALTNSLTVKKRLDKNTALLKLQRFCAYQDRCHAEVRSKLIELGVYGDDIEEVMTELIKENFLNEERFAKSFARGKFRMKQWGRQRILQGLQARHISEYCIKKGLAEIDETEYRATLRTILQRKKSEMTETNPFAVRQKLMQYAFTRGFETELTAAILEEI